MSESIDIDHRTDNALYSETRGRYLDLDHGLSDDRTRTSDRARSDDRHHDLDLEPHRDENVDHRRSDRHLHCVTSLIPLPRQEISIPLNEAT